MSGSQLLSSLKLTPARQSALQPYFDFFDIWFARHTELISSLSNGIDAFEKKTDRLLTNLPSESDDTKHKLLLSWFLSFLRFRDSQVFAMSGECRHPHDVSEAKKSKLSKLKTKGIQGDGYTEYFKADHYSGFGWDEFNDDEVGIHARIKTALGGKRAERYEEKAEWWLNQSDEFSESVKVFEQQFKKCRERGKSAK